ncbi:phage tail tape measure protein [Microbacterium sp. KR10-403]|uniref:phage tail tape measure protein n=1 Tax=Microbacterium sp. KR10-403 TaxID=3158581 RepID=UPI0032E3F893
MSFDAGALIFKIQTAGAQTAQAQLRSLDQTVQGVGKTSTDAKGKVDQLGTSTDAAGKKAQQSKAPLQEQAKATQDVGDKALDAGKKQQQQSKITQEQIGAFKELSKGLLIAGTAIGALIGLSVAKYAEFDQAMSNTAAATMATKDEQKKLGDAALKAGADTAYSAKEAAEAEEELAKAGQSVSDIVGGSLNGALALAAAGQLGVARSAEIMATTLTQFKLPAEQAAHVSDVLAAGAGKAQGSVDDLALALTYVGPLAQAAHWSLDETAGTLAYFASQGILGEKAGTSLRGVLAALQSPSRQAASVMEQYGLTVYDANGNMLSASEIAGNMQKAFAGLTDEERNAALGRIFGNESLTAANLLYAGGADAINTWTDSVNDSGYAAEQAAMRQDNLAGDVEKLGGAFDTALIKTGSGANDVLREMVQSVTALVDWYGELPEPVQATALVFGVATGAVLLFQGATLGLVTKFVELRKTLQLANISLGRTALVGAGVGIALAGVLTVVGLLAQAQVEARQKAQAYADTLEEGTNRITKSTTDMVKANLAAKQSWWVFESDSAYDAAEKLGVGLDLVTKAAMGDVDALKQLNEQIDAGANGSERQKQRLKETGLGLVEYGNATKTLTQAVAGEAGSLKEAIRVAEQKNSVTAEGTEVTKSAADAYLEAAGNVDDLESQLSKLIDQINKANGVGQDAVSANIDYQDSLAKLDKQVANVKKGTEDYKKTLDTTTAAGRDNYDQLIETAKGGQKAADAALAVDHNTDKWYKSLKANRDKILQNAKDLGATDEQLQYISEHVVNMPTQHDIDVTAKTAAAQSALDALQRRYDNAVINIRVQANGISTIQSTVGRMVGISRADGGVIEAYANGGIREDHVAQFARAGAYRVWAEPETGGEAYIPLSPAKRGTSVPVLAETANRMGFDIVPAGSRSFADGGIHDAPAVAPQVRVVVSSKGGIDLLKYIDVQVEQSKAATNFALRRS